MYRNNMQEDEPTNIEIVKQVEKYPAIYNTGHPGYGIREEQDKAWEQICADMNISVHTLKERWRNLRMCLGRYLRQKNSLEPGKRPKKPYYLAKHMEFILPFSKWTTSNDSYSGSGKQIFESFYTTQEYDYADDDNSKDTKPVPQLDEDVVGVLSSHSRAMIPTLSADEDHHSDNVMYNNEEGEHFANDYVKENKLKRKLHDSLMRDLTSYIDDRITRTPTDNGRHPSPISVNNHGADLEFFRSLLPDVAQMTPAQKSKFRMTVLGSINSILYEKS